MKNFDKKMIIGVMGIATVVVLGVNQINVDGVAFSSYEAIGDVLESKEGVFKECAIHLGDIEKITHKEGRRFYSCVADIRLAEAKKKIARESAL